MSAPLQGHVAAPIGTAPGDAPVAASGAGSIPFAAPDTGRSAAAEPHLRLEGLTRRFGTGAVLAADNVSLSLPKGALLALLGPSGCGKTTTLRMIAGLERPDSGRVVVAGRDVTALPPHRRNMGVVFQSYALFPHMTAAGNAAFGLEMRGLNRTERRERAAEALAMVGLEALADRRPRAMSGGQQQRVALARALAIRPDLLLLDEPLSALDAKLRDSVRDEIRALQQRLGTTAVFVTHDQGEALAMADLVGVMNSGRLEQLDTPEAIFERPATRFVATFVGRATRFRGTVEPGGVFRAAGGGALQVASTLPPGPAEAFLRPHRVHFVPPGAAAPGDAVAVDARILRRTYTGEAVAIEADTPLGPLHAEFPAHAPAAALRPGDTARLAIRAADLRVFAA